MRENMHAPPGANSHSPRKKRLTRKSASAPSSHGIHVFPGFHVPQRLWQGSCRAPEVRIPQLLADRLRTALCTCRCCEKCGDASQRDEEKRVNKQSIYSLHKVQSATQCTCVNARFVGVADAVRRTLARCLNCPCEAGVIPLRGVLRETPFLVRSSKGTKMLWSCPHLASNNQQQLPGCILWSCTFLTRHCRGPQPSSPLTSSLFSLLGRLLQTSMFMPDLCTSALQYFALMHLASISGIALSGSELC